MSTQQGKLIALIREAQYAIVSLPMGGIGENGPTQAELDAADEEGRCVEDDACHHQGQKAWLLLERAANLAAEKTN